MELAKGVLCRAGHSSLNNLYGIDPYANRSGFGDDEMKRLREKVATQTNEIRMLKDEIRTLKRGGGPTPAMATPRRRRTSLR